jgi:hypothetical protein
MLKRKTKAQSKFEWVNRVNIPKNKEIFENAIINFGIYMYELALQNKLFTIQKVDGDEYMRPVNSEKE